jgi:Predicted membrane protein
MSFKRVWRHLISTDLALKRHFDAAALTAIERAIAQSEARHGGEIRVAIEGHLSTLEVLKDITPRARALQAFGELGVWDTEANNGVLIYVLWADHDVEIVADRGFNGRVTPAEWEEVCRAMERLFAQRKPVEAVLTGIEQVGTLIAKHYPLVDRNELSNRPVLL